ncbi:MAG: hypothetical protein JWO71_2483 [Candidatus Acidoferrum typicum]|nr:hypothetical protein [Candidatus Acidoferrum typicum]
MASRTLSRASMRRLANNYDPKPYRVSGTIRRVDFDRQLVKITSDQGTYSAFTSRINARNGHGCIVRPGDRVTFGVIEDTNHAVDINFVDPPDVQLPEEEVSRITRIAEMIFAKRVEPNCRCPIFIGLANSFPELQVGDKIHHTVGKDQAGKPIATNIRKLETK